MEQKQMIEKKTVLVVDDTPEILWQVSSILKGRYNIKLATSGFKAIEIAKTFPVPHLILLDIVMPEMDGYDVCLALKGMAGTREIPVVFLTARSSSDDEKHGRMLGAVDYIKKPIDPIVILSSVAKYVA